MGGDRRVDRILAQGETIRCYPTKVDHRHGAPFSTSGTMSHRTTTGRRGRREPAGTSARSSTARGAARWRGMPAGARSPPPGRAKADAPAAPGLRAGRHATFGRPWRRPSRLRSGAGAADSGPDAGVADPNHARRCAASNEEACGGATRGLTRSPRELAEMRNEPWPRLSARPRLVVDSGRRYCDIVTSYVFAM